MISRVLIRAMVFCSFVLAAQANSITFTLDQDGCSSSCGTAPFGTVTITDVGSGVNAYVHVTETLASGEVYALSASKEALEFNVDVPSGIVDITDINDLIDFAAAASG